MVTATYKHYSGQLETYFDRTARDAWVQLTSEAPVSKIRATVRAGRERMRSTLLDWLPVDLSGRRVLDAGCGTGAAAIELAKRGAKVIAVDVSASLIEIARERTPVGLQIDWRRGDMLDFALGSFDHILAMDSLIHYPTDDIVAAIADLGERATRSMLFTVAPRTPALTLMHNVGKLFPRSDRAPAIQPVPVKSLHRQIAESRALNGWHRGREETVSGGFYTSHALELVWQ
ncbi:magnesium protoporphyrin IX methyltransferase [Aquisediminimonas profunda]|uniref:magnesium protoporphyrin IX methyltransferase n=1 Tax=Aquisediminimonas profunda TaxID=1550733 RepID=UPI001C630281|nr:magnesium protoporphyrin IX methyltransferase [Aquisediminimonas profunda]